MEGSDSGGPPRASWADIVSGNVSTPAKAQFRFGTRSIQAAGSTADNCHPNVLLLRIEPSVVQSAVQFLFRVLSLITGPWVESKFPEWFLPDRIVLKSQKPDWEEEFDNELLAYNKLQPVQGITVPKLYGMVQHENTRALILSDIGGHCVATPKGAVLDEEDMRPLIYQAFKSINEFGVSHEDTKLDNFHLVMDEGKDKIMIVDLESADYEQTEEDLAYTAKSKTNFVMRLYRSHLQCMEYDEILLPKRPLRA
ncbi:hypothetical protein F53441_14246 [Fusarium austroafricanum]|uniref:Protein kinase domain-containing protein n=1 Tax=Fusarium austroafricanum TaxID=2364996 RepID=A0A8H4JI03_9HYPO|nr:hypothetical protein F53441_14246 [Fusarium austroafricanum]